MSTINASRVGYIVGTGGSSFATSRTANGSSAIDSPTGNVLSPIQSFFSSGRGGGVYRQSRTYIYFDTSGITGTVTSATLKITSHTSVSSDVIVLNGQNAFGGDGNTALNVDDFDEVNMAGISEAFSSQFTPWVSQTVNSISLNSNAFSALSSDDDTVMGVMNYTYDYSNQAPATSLSVSAGIAFGTTIQLEYFEAGGGPSNVKKVDSVGSQDISKWNGVSWADIVALNSVT
tara:strand:+ start:106 stop:801 length:696 start_codon:yes stop_codon:yes gene_type:complete